MIRRGWRLPLRSSRGAVSTSMAPNGRLVRTSHRRHQLACSGTRMHKAIFALVILLLSLTASANASQLDDAVTAVHNGDYAIAHQLLRELAGKGDARAQFDIGCMYANGWG